jgi:hypothetical protein
MNVESEGCIFQFICDYMRDIRLERKEVFSWICAVYFVEPLQNERLAVYFVHEPEHSLDSMLHIASLHFVEEVALTQT